MVRAKKYVPERGDIVWLDFDPQTGFEQKGKRPALVITPKLYNEKVGLAVFCPITSRIKNYPFEVVIDEKKLSGAILSDQIKSLDWRARKAEFIIRASDEAFEEVIENLKALLLFEV